MKAKLLRAILISLLQCDGVPMPESALIAAAQILCRPVEPTDGDVRDQIKTLQGDGYIEGVTDELTQERTWSLTTKGTHKARQLR
jgi:hypothetical protein